eukprot:CAMPEP_0206435090 /NCGR_PEP_ID=MMETSP0324_2-20121206/9614_1 /ASSEMBLY_ACC=CAM_ASM_000836 /TAXON_ID=2866 /ORGANISM="Crypthecodinium cohnii, Strain Seligo" /LENGTH=119 /DNA_ID=CAMNT_0053901865 /DNA_START=386 /DNA_END=745 /DNA_ORIENTATION=+
MVVPDFETTRVRPGGWGPREAFLRLDTDASKPIPTESGGLAPASPTLTQTSLHWSSPESTTTPVQEQAAAASPMGSKAASSLTCKYNSPSCCPAAKVVFCEVRDVTESEALDLTLFQPR